MGCLIVLMGLIFCWIYGWAEGLFYYAIILAACVFVMWLQSKIDDHHAAEKAPSDPQTADRVEPDPLGELELELQLTEAGEECSEAECDYLPGHVYIEHDKYLDPPYPVSGKQAYYVGKKAIGLSPRKGYSKGMLVGMYHRGLLLQDIGKFEGYAEAQEGNSHDLYAIAVYREDHTHVGFLMRGQRDVWEHIHEQGGYVHVYGYIACKGILAEDESPVGWFAEVCVEVDPLLVVERNAPYKTTDKFYPYTPGWLQTFLSEKQQAKEQ